MPFGWGKKDNNAAPDTRALDAFEQALPGDPGSTGPVAGWTDRHTRDLIGRDVPLFTAFQVERVRTSVAGGALRFLTADTSPSLVGWNARDGWRSDWPSVEPGVVFASDWMGRLFMLSAKRKRPNGEPAVALLVPTTGEFVVLDYSFGEFLEAMATAWRNLLDVVRLDDWRAAGGQVPSFDQCIAPKTPLVLGGSDDLDGLEVSFLVVTVSLGGQIWEQVKNLPAGTKISGVSIQ